MKFGASDYRQAAIERLGEAQMLLRVRRLAGSVYLAGRGVESMLRALVWKGDADVRRGRKSLETGHNLAQLLEAVANLGLFVAGHRDTEFKAAVNRVSTMWHNDLRFASQRYLESLWRKNGKMHKGETLGFAVGRYFEDCSAIIKRGEELCQE